MNAGNALRVGWESATILIFVIYAKSNNMYELIQRPAYSHDSRIQIKSFSQKLNSFLKVVIAFQKQTDLCRSEYKSIENITKKKKADFLTDLVTQLSRSGHIGRSNYCPMIRKSINPDSTCEIQCNFTDNHRQMHQKTI